MVNTIKAEVTINNRNTSINCNNKEHEHGGGS
jgi:hypothetical protein